MMEVYSELEEWGKYQTYIFLLITIPVICRGMQSMIGVVAFHVPQHRCRITSWPGDSYSIQTEEHRQVVNQIIPRTHDDLSAYSQCSIFSGLNDSVFTDNSTIGSSLFTDNSTTGSSLFTDNSTTGSSLFTDNFLTGSTLIDAANLTMGSNEMPCQAWVYDKTEMDSSLITQFDLVCDRKVYRAHLHMSYLLGSMIGSLLSGYVCDWCGRKTVFYISTVMCLIIGVIAAFPPSRIVFMLYRVLLGILGTANYLSAFVLLVELVGVEKRTRAASLLTMVWLIGPFTMAGLSFLLRDWHYLQLISVLPLALCSAHWWLLPESPRWLWMKNKKKAALKIIHKIAAVNKRSLPVELENGTHLQGDPKVEERREAGILHSVTQLLKHPRLLVMSLVICLNWCSINMTYYGLSLNVGNLGGSVRVNFVLSCCVEVIGYLLGWLLLQKVGRKRSLCCFMLLAGLACLSTVFTVAFGTKDLEWTTTGLAMIGKLGISASFSAVYLITAELFPTTIRNFTLACASCFGKVGSILSPYIADLALYVGGRYGRVIPLVIFGGLALLSGLLALTLPETLHRPLPDTVEDAINLSRNPGKDRKDKGVDEDKEEETEQNCPLTGGTSTDTTKV